MHYSVKRLEHKLNKLVIVFARQLVMLNTVTLSKSKHIPINRMLVFCRLAFALTNLKPTVVSTKN